MIADSLVAKRIFEPFYFRLPEYVALVRPTLGERSFEWPFANVYYPFFGKTLDNDPTVEAYVRSSLIGSLDGWVESNSGGDWLRSVRSTRQEHFRRRVVTKFVRGSFIVPALRRVFDVPVVHIWRDPRAVLASLQRRGWRWLEHASLDALLAEGHEGRVRYVEPWLDDLQHLDAEGDWACKTAAYWSLVEHYVEASTRDDPGVVTVQYERLVLNPHLEMDRIHRQLSLKPAVSANALNAASATTQAERRQISKQERLKSWRHELTPLQAQSVEATVTEFGMAHRLKAVDLAYAS
jgi:hypothetical protein